MIKDFYMENFQSHWKTLIRFVPGVNVITGPNGAGKTPIQRGMQLLFQNRPLGFKYHTRQQTDPKTRLWATTYDDVRVDLSKTEKKGRYIVKSEGKRHHFKTKKDVPDVVVQASNVSDINFIDSDDPPFLITSTSGTILKELNRVMGAEEVDPWISELTSKINFKRKEKEKIKAEIKALNISKKKYKGLPELRKKVKEAARLEARIVRLNRRNDELFEISEGVKSLMPKVKKTKSLITFLKRPIVALMNIDEEIEGLSDRMDAMDRYEGLTNSWNTADKEFKFLAEEYKRLLKEQGICGECGTKMSDRVISRMVKELR